MSKLYNRARVTVSSTGTGTLTLSTAVAGYQTFTSAGVQNNDVVSYVIEDGLNWEVGEGTYTSSTNTLTRTVTQSFNGSTYGTSPISVTASAQVFISPLAADILVAGNLGTNVVTALGNATNSASGVVQLDASAKLPAIDGSAVTNLNASNLATGTVPGERLPREVLSANRTYYVRTDGSDSNNGLTNSSGGAFLTIQKAVNVVATLDISTYTVTIKLGNSGTWTSGVTVSAPWVGTGEVILQGDTTTPSNTIISTTNANCVTVQAGARLSVQSFKMTTTTGGSCLNTTGGTIKILGGLDFGACASTQITASNLGRIYANYGTGAYTISGGGWGHWFSDSLSQVSVRATTITITGTPAFSIQFAIAQNVGIIYADSLTFSGTATGTRYSSTQNSVIATGGAGATYLPGNVAGTTATGGLYI